MRLTHPPASDASLRATLNRRVFYWRLFGASGMTQYVKPPLSFQAQQEQLQSRGLAFADRSRADIYLQRVGYYRLMGYLYPQRELNSDNFKAGSSFEAAIGLYEFDRALRDLVMEAIGHIEVATRTLLTYHFSHSFGAFGHLEAANFAFTSLEHETWLTSVNKEVERSRETFIRHYQSKYTDPAFPKVPIWMATEIMSLGSLSRFYSALRRSEQRLIAQDAGIAIPVFKNWLHVTSVARNIVAHHGRLWNKELGVSAMRPHLHGWSDIEAPFPARRAFFLVLVLRKLLGMTAADASDWRDRVDVHLKRNLINDDLTASFGAAAGWETHGLWR